MTTTYDSHRWHPVRMTEITTRQPRPATHACPMGYAPYSNGDRRCFYCGDDKRIDSHYVAMPVRYHGDPPRRWQLREAHQTTVPGGPGWIDLAEIREELKNASRGRGGYVAPYAVNNAIRALPER